MGGATAPLVQFDDVNWMPTGGGAGAGAGAAAGRPMGGSIASNMINNVMNIDDDFPPRQDRNVGLSAGVQPLPPSFKMTAQD